MRSYVIINEYNIKKNNKWKAFLRKIIQQMDKMHLYQVAKPVGIM